MKKIALYLAVLIAVLLSNVNQSNAQIATQSGTAMGAGWTIDSLVRNVLLGEGVEVFNVQFNGSTGVPCNAIGTFSGGGATNGIGITNGIVMATGGIAQAHPSATGVATQSTCSPYSATTPLHALAPANTSVNDVACLEFDFICRSDSINFRYVFASEEYPGYVCSSFNDIFGFFLTGIAPSGMPFSFYNDYNIALIPGTDPPQIVSINTVNGGTAAGTATPCVLTNTNYFISNPSNSSYGGCTTVLTAKAKVMPCQTYHIKLVIADLGDGSYDSGVFLEANSLVSNGISAHFTQAANPQNPTNVYEGCCATIDLSRPQGRPNPVTLNVSTSGTATNGADYQAINQTMAFPANTNSFNIEICPFMDGLVEGSESVMVVLTPEDGCPDTVHFTILDTDPIAVNAEVVEPLDATTRNVTLRANITGGMPNRNVTWTNVGTGEIRTGEEVNVPTTISNTGVVAPNTLWACRVEDFCYNVADDTVCVAIMRNFAALYRDTMLCAGEQYKLIVLGADSVRWYYNDDYLGNNNPDSLYITIREGINHVYTDSYRFFNGQWWYDRDSVLIVGVALPDVEVTANRTEICPGETVTLTATGVTNFSWDGGNTFNTNSSHTYTLDTTTMLVVYGTTQAAGCPGSDSILIVVDKVPTITITSGGDICGGGEVELSVTTDATTFSWTSTPTDPTLADQIHSGTIFVSPSVTTTYTVNATFGVCNNTESKVVSVEPMPEAIGEVTPQTVSLGNMQVTFVDHSRHSDTRLWVFPDGTTRDTKEVEYVIDDDIDTLAVTLIAYNPYYCTDTTVVYAYVDHSTLWIPNAFMPDETANNRFEVKMNAIYDYYIKIYDRAGHLMFESTNPEEHWDGRNRSGEKCPQGAYVYFISIHKAVPPHEQLTYSGTVLIIR